jgi:cell division septation protein DedD
VSEEALVPNDEGAPDQGGITEAELVKESEVKLPVESEPKAAPEPYIPEVTATGTDKSVSEIVPPASVQLEVPGNTQAPVTEEAPVSADGGAPAQGRITAGPQSQSYRYVVQFGSFVDKGKSEEIKTRLEGKGYNAVVKTVKHQALGKVFVIQLQPVDSLSRAATLMTQLSGEIEDKPVISKVPSR